MLKCWEANPSDRPTFTELKNTMKEMERNHRVMQFILGLVLRIRIQSILTRGPKIVTLSYSHYDLPSV